MDHDETDYDVEIFEQQLRTLAAHKEKPNYNIIKLVRLDQFPEYENEYRDASESYNELYNYIMARGHGKLKSESLMGKAVNMDINNFNTVSSNDYYYGAKIDGIRFLMMFSNGLKNQDKKSMNRNIDPLPQPQIKQKRRDIYFIDSNNNFWMYLHNNNKLPPVEHIGGCIFDGELLILANRIIPHKNKNGEIIKYEIKNENSNAQTYPFVTFVAFDMLYGPVNKIQIINKQQKSGYNTVGAYIGFKKSEDWPTINRRTMLEEVFTHEKSILRAYNIGFRDYLFMVTINPFYRLNILDIDINSIFKNPLIFLQDLKNKLIRYLYDTIKLTADRKFSTSHKHYLLIDDKVEIKTDGVIFTPINGQYIIDNWTFCNNKLLKWKPRSEMTIDVKLGKKLTNNTYEALNNHNEPVEYNKKQFIVEFTNSELKTLSGIISDSGVGSGSIIKNLPKSIIGSSAIGTGNINLSGIVVESVVKSKDNTDDNFNEEENNTYIILSFRKERFDKTRGNSKSNIINIYETLKLGTNKLLKYLIFFRYCYEFPERIKYINDLKDPNSIDYSYLSINKRRELLSSSNINFLDTIYRENSKEYLFDITDKYSDINRIKYLCKVYPNLLCEENKEQIIEQIKTAIDNSEYELEGRLSFKLDRRPFLPTTRCFIKFKNPIEIPSFKIYFKSKYRVIFIKHGNNINIIEINKKEEYLSNPDQSEQTFVKSVVQHNLLEDLYINNLSKSTKYPKNSLILSKEENVEDIKLDTNESKTQFLHKIIGKTQINNLIPKFKTILDETINKCLDQETTYSILEKFILLASNNKSLNESLGINYHTFIRNTIQKIGNNSYNFWKIDITEQGSSGISLGDSIIRYNSRPIYYYKYIENVENEPTFDEPLNKKLDFESYNSLMKFINNVNIQNMIYKTSDKISNYISPELINLWKSQKKVNDLILNDNKKLYHILKLLKNRIEYESEKEIHDFLVLLYPNEFKNNLREIKIKDVIENMKKNYAYLFSKDFLLSNFINPKLLQIWKNDNKITNNIINKNEYFIKFLYNYITFYYSNVRIEIEYSPNYLKDKINNEIESLKDENLNIDKLLQHKYDESLMITKLINEKEINNLIELNSLNEYIDTTNINPENVYDEYCSILMSICSNLFD